MLVGIVQEASFRDVEIPDRLNRRIEAHHGKGERAVVVLNSGILLGHAHHVTAERNVVAQELDIVTGEANRHACLISSGLLRRTAGEDANGGGPETLKNGLDCFAEAIAVGEQ